MFCPQCGTESSSGQQYCRMCGANLKFIGKAVTLSEAIARSDRGPLPKIKEMMKSMSAEQTNEEVSHALDQMNKEIVHSFGAIKIKKPSPTERKPTETPEQRREKHIVKGSISLFSGIALMIFLYYFSAALVLKIPPETLARIPFEVEPVVRMLWLIGLIPALSGMGRIIAGLLLRPSREAEAAALKSAEQTEQLAQSAAEAEIAPPSVTERTTDLLNHKATIPDRK